MLFILLSLCANENNRHRNQFPQDSSALLAERNLFHTGLEVSECCFRMGLCIVLFRTEAVIMTLNVARAV